MTESTHQDVPQQLVANPRRQAHDKIRGYLYQIWQSVHAWIDLGENEILALEGGEDFDEVGVEGAVVNQVKDLARNLTLRSEDAVEAIGNFWDLKEKNRGRRLLFRFLTTAQAGVEKGSPFGEEISGIEHWGRAARSGKDLDRLRSFLLEQPKLPESLQDFLKTASDEEVRKELLQPFEWWLGLEPVDYIKEAVQRKLISYSEKRNVLAQDAEKVAPHLLDAAFLAASRKTRRVLDRSDFVKIFDNVTAKHLSQAEVLAVAAAFFPPASFPGTQALPGPGTYSPISAPPPLPPRLARRERLVAHFSSRLIDTGGLVLMGSTGMGKSTLAKLLVGPRWIWVNLRSGPSGNPSWVLAQIAHHIDNVAGQPPEGIVFDDYLSESSDENFFGSLIYTLRAKGINFIITTSRDLPSRLSSNFDLEPSSFKVPGLSRTEIEGWLSDCGCPLGLLQDLSGFLATLTSGHPQLLHARIGHLLRTGWREPELEDLVETPSSVAQVRREARELLRRLPDGARIFAYRLSMAAQPFRRDHALAMSLPAPQVPLPGESFDALFGPWIEPLTDRYFRVSPLLSGVAQEVFPDRELKALHKAWGETLFGTLPMSHTEAVGSFFHAFMAEDLQTLIGVAYALLNSEPAAQKAAFASLQWFATIGVEARMPDFIPASEKRLSLRLLQYRLAEEPGQRRRIATTWDEESRSFPLESEDRRPVYRQLFLLSVFMDRDARHEISRLFIWLKAIVDLVREARVLYPELVASIERAPKDTDLQDFAAAFLLSIVVQCSSAEDLSSFLDGLEKLEEQLRMRVLQLFVVSPGTATSLVDGCWLAEKESAHPDWERCLAVLERVKRQGDAWGCNQLRDAAARAKISIYNEVFAETEAALELLSGESADVRRSALLLDQRATLLQERNEHEAALAIWREELPSWTKRGELGEVSLVYAYKKAAASAGHLGRWTEAARLFQEAFTRLDDHFTRHPMQSGPAEQRALKLTPVELLVDHAFSLWRAGQRGSSLESFATALSRISALTAELGSSDRYIFLTRVVATMFLWLTGHSRKVVPFPGAASTQKNPEGIQDLPPTGTDNLWAMLCLLELKAGVQGGTLERAGPLLTRSADPLTVYMFRQAVLGQKLRSGDLEALLPTVVAWTETLFESRDQAPHASERLGFLFGVLRIGLLSFSHHRPGLAPPWEEWRSFIEVAFPEDAALAEPWFQHAAETFALSPVSLTKILSTRGGDPHFTFCTARAAACKGLSPEAIFVAQVFFVLSIQSRLFDDVVGYLTSDVVESQWRRLTDSPALLVSPRLNVPAILEACDMEEPGLRKAAAILLAAAPAVRVELGENQTQALKAIARGE